MKKWYWLPQNISIQADIWGSNVNTEGISLFNKTRSTADADKMIKLILMDSIHKPISIEITV